MAFAGNEFLDHPEGQHELDVRGEERDAQKRRYDGNKMKTCQVREDPGQSNDQQI